MRVNVLGDGKAYSATDHGEILAFKMSVNIVPRIPRPDGSNLLVGGECDFIDLFQGDSDAALDTRCTTEGSMPAALNGKGALREARQ